MKKSLLFFLLFNIYFFTPAIAQLEKGNIFMDGKIGLFFNDDNSEFSFNTNWLPTAGYFVHDNVLIGTGFSLLTTKQDNNNRKSRVFEIKPFFRYYFASVTRFKPYGQLDMAINKTKNDFGFGSSKTSETSVFLRTGFNYFISKNVAFNTNLAFRFNKNVNNIFFEDKDFIFYFGNEGRVNLSIGFNFFLGRKADNETTAPLIERYLKKGNQSVGLSGIGFAFDGGQFISGTTKWQKFTKDKVRWSHSFSAFLSNNLFDNFAGFFFYRPEYERYFNLSGNAYLISSIGIIGGVSSNFSFDGDDSEFYFGGTFHPKLAYFFNNGLMEIGMDIRTPLTNFGNDDWSGTFSLAGEYFIQNNLSVRGEARVSAFGNRNIEVLSNILLTQNIPQTSFTIGFNYFFNKGIGN